MARVLRRVGARWIRAHPGDRIVQFDGVGHHDELMLVVEGKVIAYDKEMKQVLEVSPGHFLAETSLAQAMTDDDEARILLANDTESDDEASHLYVADAVEASLILIWPALTLGKALKADAQLRDAFRQALALDLSRKIAREEIQNFQISKRRRHRNDSVSPTLYLKTLFRGDSGSKSEASINSDDTTSFMSSRRGRRKRSVMSVLRFVRSNSASKKRDRRPSLKPLSNTNDDDSGSSLNTIPRRAYAAADPPVSTRKAPTEKVPVSRPSIDDTRRKLGAFLASLGVGLSLLVAFLAVVYMYIVEGPSSAVGNGSQALITGAFAISDPLRLQLVSFVGSTAQASFFIFRYPRIWSSIAWSSTQALVNFCMATYLICRNLHDPMNNGDQHSYTDRELFAARLLERSAPISLQALRSLIVGTDDATLIPVWRTMHEPGDPIPDDNIVCLVTDGVVRVTRSHAPSFDAHRGALLGGHSLHIENIQINITQDDDVRTFDHATALSTPVELLCWNTSQLATFLSRNPDARRAFTILLASHACETYLDSFYDDV
eukprot:CAMPEP_0197300038 /NCGR_PEP_ID=MMETSP0890-20130614/47424_1 /TAXON_ID=44058 ORGANISM="Aureoumbra lagunensis, Strain CCMP1510" /NCGR_SAMPLE_ID=MMETSP0890 /ASSEMBLY_ACC=CAM_ASM_000533 /LENGTH=546 /DNA_ID=CAMNT_0042778663 /DNA_START=449 /DNA_END=2089 /DNA_ORIENTATION=+